MWVVEKIRKGGKTHWRQGIDRCEAGMEREKTRERRKRNGGQVWKGSGSDRREKRRGTGWQQRQVGVFGRTENGRYGDLNVSERE